MQLCQLITIIFTCQYNNILTTTNSSNGVNILWSYSQIKICCRKLFYKLIHSDTALYV